MGGHGAYCQQMKHWRWVVLLIALAGCGPKRVVTVPRGTQCPPGYRFLYADHERQRWLCIRDDSSHTQRH
jgi:hypothetical protein